MSDTLDVGVRARSVHGVRHRYRPFPGGRAGAHVTVTVDLDDQASRRRPLELELTFVSGIEQDAGQSWPEHHPPGEPYRYSVEHVQRKVERLVSYKKNMEEIEVHPVSTLHHDVHVAVHLLRGMRLLALVNGGDRGTTAIERPCVIEAGVLRIVLQVVVVQDGRRLPVAGAPLDTEVMHPLLFHGEGGVAGVAGDRAWAALVTRYRPNAVDFVWPAIEQTLSLELADPLDGRSGFACWVDDEPALRRLRDRGRAFARYDGLLHLCLCGDVRVALNRPRMLQQTLEGVPHVPDPLAWRDAGHPVYLPPVVEGPDGVGLFREPLVSELPAHFRSLASTRFFRIRRVPSLVDLPAADQPFRVAESDDEAASGYAGYLTAEQRTPWLELAVDLGIGAIPILGDLVDFADFNLALATGRDKWGHEVDGIDLILMGLAVLPLVGTAFSGTRKATRLLR